MTSTDPIADMLSRIRNAIAARKMEVALPYSAQKKAIADILLKNGFLRAAKVSEYEGRKVLEIVINDTDSVAAITTISRVSRPGRREYVQAKGIPVIKRGRGLVVISTSRGVMSGEEAKRLRLGGELICQVY